MARLGEPRLSSEQMQSYRAMVAPGEELARLSGDAMPDTQSLDNLVGLLFHAPALAPDLFALAARLSQHKQLSEAVHETVILRVAQRERSAYEWLTHLKKADRAGVDPHQLEPTLAAAVDDVLDGRPLPESLAQRLGPAAAVEFVMLCGMYQLFAHLASAFELPLPPGTENPFAG